MPAQPPANRTHHANENDRGIIASIHGTTASVLIAENNAFRHLVVSESVRRNMRAKEGVCG
jgi:hypothetical protein